VRLSVHAVGGKVRLARDQKHPQRRVRQFLAQSLEHLVPRIRSVVVRALLERVGLCGGEKSPEMVFNDAMFGVRDVGLFEFAIAVHANEEVRNVLLKGQLGRFLLGMVSPLPPSVFLVFWLLSSFGLFRARDIK